MTTRAARSLFDRLPWLGAAIALLLLVVIVAAISPDFRKPENPFRMINQWSFVGIVAIGMTYVIILGGIDLSVGSMVALLGGIAIYGMNAAADAGASPVLAVSVAVGVALLGGPLLGLVNGLGITLGRIAPFIATLSTMAIYRSIILAVADGSQIGSQVREFEALGSGGVGLPFVRSSMDKPILLTNPTIAFFLMAVVAQLVLTRTVFGRQVTAIGDNPTAARYAGVRIAAITCATYALGGSTCGAAALFNSSRMTSVSSAATGVPYELDAIAAVVIGGTRMSGGAGSVIGTVIGVLFLAVISNTLSMLDVSAHLQGLVKGCIIVAAVLMQRGRARS